MTASIRDVKSALRRELLHRRAMLDEDELRSVSRALIGPVLDATAGATCIAIYLSAGSEPGTWGVVDALRSRGVEVLAPVVRAGGRLDWAAYEGSEAVRTNRFALPEPTGPRLGAGALTRAGFVVLPGLAVDRAGWRLGRGGGFYDRALAYPRVTATRLLLLHDSEVLADVPHESHDQVVHAAITPLRTLPLPGPSQTTP